jgi:hypothetical protein
LPPSEKVVEISSLQDIELIISEMSMILTSSFAISAIMSFVATVAFAIFVVAAVAFTMVLLSEMSSDSLVWYFLPNNSLNPAGRFHMFHLHPSNTDIATLMFYTLPTLALVNVLLSVRTHLAKLLVTLTWIASLFILEEIFFIELLRPELFVAVLALSAMYLLAFLRIPLVIKIAFLLIGRIVLICFRTFRIAFRLIVKIMFYGIIAPLVLRMLVEEPLHMVSNSNLPIFGSLVVYVGSSFTLMSYGIFKKLHQLALRLFDVIADAIASWIVHLPPAANAAAAAHVIAFLPPAAQEDMPVVTRSPQRIVGLPEHVLVARPEPAKVIRWSDGAFVENRFRPHYTSGHTISSRLFTGNESNRRRLEKHAWKFGVVLDELVGLLSGVCFVPMHEEGRCDWRAIRAVVDENYAMHWNAQGAFRDLVSVYNRFKSDHPRRFRSWSEYEKKLAECNLFEQGIDILLLEMRLLAEFEPSPALRIVRDTWEKDAYDDAEEIQEAVNAPAEVVAVEEPINFNPMDVAEEEEPLPNLRRRRRRSEAARLNSELGKYWVCHPRRSGRVRRQPVRYEP